MDSTTVLVPVILRQHYAKHREDYYATVCLLADKQGNVLTAGVGFQSNLDQHSKAVGRNVAIGRAVKVLAKNAPNSFGVPSGHIQRVNRELGTPIFNEYKGVRVGYSLPSPIQDIINEAVKHRTRLKIDLEALKWKFIESESI